jgi:hypothetical protein
MDENGTPEPQISDYDPANQVQEPETSYEPVEPESPWADVLAKVPDNLRPELNPALEDYTKRLQSEWEGYSFLRENEIDPQTVQYAMNILYTLNNNPRQLYDAIGMQYKFAQEQSESPDLPDDLGQTEDDPRIARLEQGLQNMARMLLEARQQQEVEEEDSRLQQELEQARQKYGDYDEGYVLGLALNGKSVDEAVRAYKQLEQRLTGGVSQQRRQPTVMGGGGAVPGQNPLDPTKLSDRETKDLVTQMLQNAARS